MADKTITSVDREHDQELRTEIIEAEKVQADLLKWKFIVIAAVASVSLGFSGSSSSTTTTTSNLTETTSNLTEGTQLLLWLVPFICAYVDLISIHLMMRIDTIGNFLRVSGSAYERFVDKVRNSKGVNLYLFEGMALHGSSIIFNGGLLGLGSVLLYKLYKRDASLPYAWKEYVIIGYIVGGFVGTVFTAIVFRIYTFKSREVGRIADKKDWR
jgi:hypothetical protein